MPPIALLVFFLESTWSVSSIWLVSASPDPYVLIDISSLQSFNSLSSLCCAVLHSPLTTHGLCQPPRRPGPYLVKAPVVGLSSKSRLCTTTAPKMWLTPSKLHFLDSPSFIAFPWWNLVNLKAEINSTHQIIQRYQLKIANPNGCWRVMGVLPHYINPIVSILYAFSNFSVTLPDRFNRSTS